MLLEVHRGTLRKHERRIGFTGTILVDLLIGCRWLSCRRRGGGRAADWLRLQPVNRKRHVRIAHLANWRVARLADVEEEDLPSCCTRCQHHTFCSNKADGVDGCAGLDELDPFARVDVPEDNLAIQPRAREE